MDVTTAIESGSYESSIASPPSCYTPTWPTTSNITQTSATFSWDAVSGAQSYSVQSRVPNGTWYNVPGSPFNYTSATVDWFLPNTTYEWRVRANCYGGEYSSWTYPVTFTTDGYSYPCEAPAWLFTTNITTNSATLDWEPVNGCVNYIVEFKVSGGSWYELPGGPFNNTWVNVYNLSPNTTYHWRVKSYCGNWVYSSWSYTETFTTLGYYCTVPTWPSTSNITHTSAKLSWSEVQGAYSYSVQVRLLNGNWYDIQGGNVYGTWVTVNGLESCTSYQWRVRSNCSGGQYSTWIYPVNFTTDCSYSCNAPYWLYTSSITSYSASFGWDPVPGAVSYSIQWRLTGGTWYDLNGGPWSNTWVNVTNLQPGTAYEWRVRSNCSNWTYSPWSYSTGFTTLGYSCATPSWLSTTNVTESSATFSWQSVWGAWSYSVQIRLANGTWSDIPGSPFVNNYANVSGLNPNTNYQWRVKSNCDDGSYSYWSYAVSFKTNYGPPCNAPIGLTTTNITSTTATLNWSAVSGALNYTVEWRLTGGLWYQLAGGPWSNPTANLTGLTPGKTYEWRVRSNCGGSSSYWSSIASFTTPQGPSCAVPGGLTTSAITDTTATLSWDTVPGGLSYGVQTRVPNGTWFDVIGSPFVGTTVTVDGLIPGATYEWRVRSKCDAGLFSNWSNPVTFTTTSASIVGSNECGGAIALTVNSSCINTSSTNEGATASLPEPMGWCPENNYKDVWFTFTMPNVSDPVVTIRTTAGTLFDGVMEVYTGADCANLSYLYCEDDNTTNNGSLMPVISITGAPNEVIWVRVWGYAGTTGTFSICVFDYESNDFAMPDNTSVVQIAETTADPIEAPETDYTEISTTLQVSPNPTRDELNVTLMQSDESKVTGVVLLDMSGKVVYAKTYETDNVRQFKDRIDVSGYSSGIYVLRVQTLSGILSEKIMITD